MEEENTLDLCELSGEICELVVKKFVSQHPPTQVRWNYGLKGEQLGYKTEQTVVVFFTCTYIAAFY